MFAFAPPRKSRRPSLTPMIDVVFLLLVFFMLAARFGQDFAIPLAAAGNENNPSDTPQVIGIQGQEISLNGVSMTLADLPAALETVGADASAPVFLQPFGETSLQDLVRVVDALRASGPHTIIIMEQP